MQDPPTKVMQIDLSKQEEEFFLQILCSVLIDERNCIVTLCKRKDNTDE